MNRTIALVEDDPNLLDIVRFNLTREGYEVVVARDGEEALSVVRGRQPGLVILDIMLPRLDGLEVCRILRKEISVPIIMLTAKADEVDKVVGLEIGADDYVTKPFSMRELLARVKAMLRRAEILQDAAPLGGDTGAGIIEVGHLRIDLERHVVTMQDRELNLSPKEYDLLVYLAQNRRRAFDRDHLLERVWGYDYGGDTRTVDVHIRWLRRKVEMDPAQPSLIRTVRGVGYKLEA